MPKRLPPLEVENMPGKQYADVDSAWCAALPTFADDIAVTIRRLLEAGYFIVKDGKLIRNPERTQKANEL